MKLLKQNDQSFTFLLGKQERDLLIALLLRFPVLSHAHFRQRPSHNQSEPAQDDALLQEALADQQKESRQHLEQWLSAENRFKNTKQGHTFDLTHPELEWMLQVLNDIRVGSWVILGQPDGTLNLLSQLDEKNVQHAWAYEMAGHFQHHLLRATEPPE